MPRSLGGKRTVPLCYSCHGKVHGHERKRPINFSELVKAGLLKARALGRRPGPKSKYGKEIIELILSLNGKSITPLEISRRLDIPKTTVYSIIKKEICRESTSANPGE